MELGIGLPVKTQGSKITLLGNKVGTVLDNLVVGHNQIPINTDLLRWLLY